MKIINIIVMRIKSFIGSTYRYVSMVRLEQYDEKYAYSNELRLSFSYANKYF